MKNSKLISAFLAILSPLLSAIAQGGFQDLGFESARLVPIPGVPGQFEFAAALPGWTGYYGSNQVTSLVPNSLTIGGANISIFDSTVAASVVIQGSYTAVLQGGGVDSSIAQFGAVPTNALFLDFKMFTAGSLAVTFAGHNVPFSPIGNGPNYTLYGGDISAYAGQIGELRFTAQAVPPDPNRPIYLDSIAFSSVPEPSVVALAILGAGAFGLGLWRRRRTGLASGRTRRSD